MMHPLDAENARSARSLRLGCLCMVRRDPVQGPCVILLVDLPLNFQEIDSDLFEVVISRSIAQHLTDDRMGSGRAGDRRCENEENQAEDSSFHSVTLGSD
jgi:hypothetical protein